MTALMKNACTITLDKEPGAVVNKTMPILIIPNCTLAAGTSWEAHPRKARTLSVAAAFSLLRAI